MNCLIFCKTNMSAEETYEILNTLIGTVSTSHPTATNEELFELIKAMLGNSCVPALPDFENDDCQKTIRSKT